MSLRTVSVMITCENTFGTRMSKGNLTAEPSDMLTITLGRGSRCSYFVKFIYGSSMLWMSEAARLDLTKINNRDTIFTALALVLLIEYSSISLQFFGAK